MSETPKDDLSISEAPEVVECGKVRLERMKPDFKEGLQDLLSDKEYLKYVEADSEEDVGIGNEDWRKEVVGDWSEDLIQAWGDDFCFAIQDRNTDEFIGTTRIYRACCPYKKDKIKADKWEEENKNAWECLRVMKKSVKNYGTDAKKAILDFVFHHLNGDRFLTACALEQQDIIQSSIKAGMKPDPEFRGQDLDGTVKDGINEEGYPGIRGDHFTEFRLKITKPEFEELEGKGFYKDVV